MKHVTKRLAVLTLLAFLGVILVNVGLYSAHRIVLLLGLAAWIAAMIPIVWIGWFK